MAFGGIEPLSSTIQNAKSGSSADDNKAVVPAAKESKSRQMRDQPIFFSDDEEVAPAAAELGTKCKISHFFSD